MMAVVVETAMAAAAAAAKAHFSPPARPSGAGRRENGGVSALRVANGD